MESHEADFRVEVQDQKMLSQIQQDYRTAALDEATMQLLDFAVKLTLHCKEMRESDIAPLRQAGFTDETILDAIHTIAYFNYANRVMDALGIEPESEMRHRRQ